MNLRWLVGNFADPEFKLTRAQQREVTRLAHRRHLSAATLMISTIGMTFCSWGLVAFGYDPLGGVLAGVGIRHARYVALGVICAFAVVAASWMYRFIYVKPVRLAMRDLGYDVCIGCGYRLQGLTDDIERCPECGHARQPLPKNVSPAEPGL